MRARAECDQLPGWRDIANPDHRRHIAGIWGIDSKDLPGPGVDAYELFRKIDAGEIDQPFLMAIPRVFVFVALGAWSVTMIGLVRDLWRRV